MNNLFVSYDLLLMIHASKKKEIELIVLFSLQTKKNHINTRMIISFNLSSS